MADLERVINLAELAYIWGISYSPVLNWDERKHPRDRSGRFTSKGGGTSGGADEDSSSPGESVGSKDGTTGGSSPKSGTETKSKDSSQTEATASDQPFRSKSLTEDERKAVREWSEDEYRAFTNSAYSEFQRANNELRKQYLGDKALNKSELVFKDPGTEVASLEEVEAYNTALQQLTDNYRSYLSEYAIAHYDGLEPGYYRNKKTDSIVRVEGAFSSDYMGDPVRQEVYGIGGTNDRNNRDYVYSKDEFERVDESAARGSLQAGETLGGLSRSDKSALFAYTHAPAQNSALRNGTDIQEIPSAVKIQDMINRTNGEAGTYYRGVTGEYAQQLLGMQAGSTFSDSGFVSTSTNPAVAQKFAGNGGAVLKIVSPGGYGTSIDVGNNIDSEFASEGEVLFNAGSQFKVVGINGNEIEVELQ